MGQARTPQGSLEPADGLDAAADSLDEFKRDALDRLDQHDAILAQLRDRVTRLEEAAAGRSGDSPRG